MNNCICAYALQVGKGEDLKRNFLDL